MKKWILIIVSVFFIIGGGTLAALAYGENFSSPLAQYSRVTTWFSGGHTGIDYRILNHDKIVAAKSGVVRESYFGRADFWDWPCDNSWNSRGNHIILDHTGNYSTWYFHLSNAGNTPAAGTSFTRGAYMALGDDTGCSTADHLHFSTKLNDTAFDPYAGNTNWVSGSPVPMGFRDQNNNERGSFNLDNTKIHDKWVGLEGAPGAPTEDDGTSPCPTFGNDPDGALVATLYYQRFQWGEIEYCGTAAATYTAYPRTYLPDVSSAYASNYWGSDISTRSNIAGCNEISLNMLYSSDGKVADSRGYYPCMDQKKLWSFDVSSLRSFTPSPLWERNDFQHNSGAIASILDVTAIVRGNKNNDTEQTAYTGVLTSGGSAGWEQVGTELFAPIIKRDSYGRTSSIDVVNTGSSDATVTVYYYNRTSGDQWNQNVVLKPNAKTTFTPSGTHGSAGCAASGQVCSARITASQPIAAVVREYNTADGLAVSTHNIFKYNTARTIYFPVVKFYRYDMKTGLEVQNITPYEASYIEMNYFKNDGTPSGCVTTAYHVLPYAHVVFNDGPCLGSNFVGTAVATSDKQIAGVAHETSVPGTQDRKKTYSALLLLLISLIRQPLATPTPCIMPVSVNKTEKYQIT